MTYVVLFFCFPTDWQYNLALMALPQASCDEEYAGRVAYLSVVWNTTVGRGTTGDVSVCVTTRFDSPTWSSGI